MMLDEQLHRWKIEEANASILAQQEMQTQSLKGILRTILQAVRNCTMKDSGARSGHER